ncbi:MAG: hypothetical protein PF961_03710 [Planctomycetota bacterium]|jgi:hypothetical protein|nr:hypothetical protein [Planctomycetota bacterium]
MTNAINEICHHAEASASWDGTTLTVDTGQLVRQWRWTANGFATCSLKRHGGRELITRASNSADWRLPGGAPHDGAELRRVAIQRNNDDGFVSEHVQVLAGIAYPAAGLELQVEIWALPGAPGIRTALSVQALPGFSPLASEQAVSCEHLGCTTLGATAIAAGYYNETQQRNQLETPILREEAIPADGVCDWASLCAIELAGEGLCLVKESNKCVNQSGHDTGAFILGSDGLRSSGWGLWSKEIGTEGSYPAWAHWTICYASDTEHARARAVRAFIAARYPHDPARDCYVLCNTWGSTAHSRDARDAAREDNVLREIDLAAEIGVDVVQIDDGWQLDLASTTPMPTEDNGWRPHPEVYPDGWGAIRAHAAKHGVTLGLWAAGTPIPLDDLQWNRDQGGFAYYKLDFMCLRDHAAFHAFQRKVRSFVRDTGHQVRINFDVTELPPRVGYFCMREYGSLYLANRKPMMPESTVYRPHTMLRDAWQLSRYQRLQDVQITIQNPRKTRADLSDAHLHPIGYCFATALMATPILFQQLQFLAPDQRKELRELLTVYRAHRSAIHRGDVSGIGASPNNTSHTGFHCQLNDGTGYLTVFRERTNTEPQVTVHLPHLANTSIRLTNLLTDTTTEHPLNQAGTLTITIDKPADYRFFRYS